MTIDLNLQSRIVFQNVACAGGFEAARPLLQGLDLSAARKHVRTLEQELGTLLYQRRIFRLTLAGQILYDYDRPLLEKLLNVGRHLRRKTSPRLTVGVTGNAAKTFLVGPLHAWLSDPEREPVDCRFGSLRELRPALETGELDLLVTALDGPRPAGFASHTLATFPLVLIVPEDNALGSAAELWLRPKLTERLIAPGPDDPVSLAFERGLARGGLSWPTRVICDSPPTMIQLVASGLGFGLTLAASACENPTVGDGGQKADDRMRKSENKPQKTGRRLSDSAPPSANSDLPSSIAQPPSPHPNRGIRELPLAGFATVPIVALWRPQDSTRLKEPLRLMREAHGVRVSAGGC